MTNLSQNCIYNNLDFLYSAFGPFTKRCERITKFRETRNLKHLFRNGLDKACFAHDTA